MAEEIIASVFKERLPDFPGGIWSIRDGRAFPIYKGYGVFGLARLTKPNLIVGATRVRDAPFIAMKQGAGKYRRVPIEFRNYIPALRAHGIFIMDGKLYVVATQGDPDAVLCTNEDRWAFHRVGKVIVSDIEASSDCLRISNSFVWNPFACEHHHHYSDILVDEQYIYLLSFSTCDERGQIVNRGALTKFNRDYSFDSIVTDETDSPHSLQAVLGKIFVCSSGTSSICSVSDYSSVRSVNVEYRGTSNFLRGLYVTESHFYVGLNRSAGRTNSGRFTQPTNGILRINRTNNAAARIKLPRNCDNVYSIIGN